MNFFILFFVFVGSAVAQTQHSYFAPTKVLHKGGYQLGVYVDSFTTTDAVDEKGKKVDREKLGYTEYKFNRVQTEIAGSYGATNDLQFSVGARFRRNHAEYAYSGEEVSVTGQGLQSTFASMMFAFPIVDDMQYVLEGTFRYTPYTNKEFVTGDDLNSNMALGDSGNELSAGGAVTFNAKKGNFITVRAGYRRPGNEISQEIYWQTEGAMAWKHIALVAGVDGVSSLNSDPYEDNPSDRPSYNNPTYLYNTQNREWIKPYVGMNFALGTSWRIELRGSSTVAGKSTDLGNAFGLNLIKRADKSETRFVDAKFKSYDIEANVTKVSPKKEYVVIDKGLADDIYKGMRMDFFEFDYIGGNVLVASGVVMKTQADTAIVKITNKYNLNKELKEGLIGRASLK